MSRPFEGFVIWESTTSLNEAMLTLLENVMFP
jgi:hypothetical protein